MKKIEFYFLILMFSCASNEQIKKLESPNREINKRFNFLNIEYDIQFQFYEKYGFTDVCERYRVLGIVKDKDILNSKLWKKLPFSDEDLEKINNISNKTDSLGNEIFNPRVFRIDSFADIRIASFFYDKMSFDTITLKKGFYLIDNEKFTIYKKDENLIYIESYYCGNSSTTP